MKYLVAALGVIVVSCILVLTQIDQPLNSTSPDGELAAALGRTTSQDSVKSTGLNTEGEFGLYRPTPSKAEQHQTSTWLETDPTIVPPKIRQDVPNLTLFGIQRSRFETLQPGDTVVMAMPEPANSINIWVEATKKNPSGSLTINGKVDGYSDYSFVMTIGSETTFATIGTSFGVYNLRGNKSHVWIGSGRAFNHHVNPNTPDFRISKPEPQTEANS